MVGKHKRKSVRIPHSSIVIDLKSIMVARNIAHPFTFLLKAGINNTTANKMLKGEAVQFNLKQLTDLCMQLNCTPNDLFALRDLPLPEHHALHEIQVLVPNKTIKTVKEWLSDKTLEEVKELMKK